MRIDASMHLVTIITTTLTHIFTTTTNQQSVKIFTKSVLIVVDAVINHFKRENINKLAIIVDDSLMIVSTIIRLKIILPHLLCVASDKRGQLDDA